MMDMRAGGKEIARLMGQLWTAKFLTRAGVSALLLSCQAPTQVRVLVSTDVGCARNPSGGIAVGSSIDFDRKAFSATSSTCSDTGNGKNVGDVGSLVIVASGDNDEVAIKVVQGQNGRNAESCNDADAASDQNCIVARRILKYIPNRTIDIEVPMLDECRGVRCDSATTCVRKACVGASLVGSDCLARGSCTLSDLPGASDAGVTEDASDATIIDAQDAAVGDAHDATADALDASLDSDPTDAANDTASDNVVFGLSDALQPMASTAFSTCTIADSGLVCWGSNSQDELGRGFVSNSELPGFVDPNVTTAKAIVGNTSTFCALQAAPFPTVCWGTSRALSDQTDAGNTTRPAVVGLLSNAADLAIGRHHICFRNATGVFCIGGNSDGTSDGYSYGQLGRKVDAGGICPVTTLPIDAGVKQLVSGREGTAALLDNGEMYGWGRSKWHEFGAPADGGVDLFAPTHMNWGLDSKPRTIAAYENHLCAILEDTTVACWGNNASGQAGSAAIGTLPQDPTRIRDTNGVNLVGATLIAVGQQSSCASTATKVYCWGSNAYGQLGVVLEAGTNSFLALEVNSAGTQSARAISLGDRHACLVTNKIWCWGENTKSQLGASPDASFQYPQPVVLPP